MIRRIKRIFGSLSKKSKLKKILKSQHVECRDISRINGDYVYVHNNGHIHLGYDIWFNSNANVLNGSVFKCGLSTYNKDAVIRIGNRTKINGTLIHSNELVELGDDCRLAPGVVILDNDSHNVALGVEARALPPKSSPVRIGNNVWIGMNSIILKGVHIGNNTIIAAGSVVSKDCDANSIYGGNPVRKIKELSND